MIEHEIGEPAAGCANPPPVGAQNQSPAGASSAGLDRSTVMELIVWRSGLSACTRLTRSPRGSRDWSRQPLSAPPNLIRCCVLRLSACRPPPRAFCSPPGRPGKRLFLPINAKHIHCTHLLSNGATLDQSAREQDLAIGCEVNRRSPCKTSAFRRLPRHPPGDDPLDRISGLSWPGGDIFLDLLSRNTRNLRPPPSPVNRNRLEARARKSRLVNQMFGSRCDTITRTCGLPTEFERRGPR